MEKFILCIDYNHKIPCDNMALSTCIYLVVKVKSGGEY